MGGGMDMFGGGGDEGGTLFPCSGTTLVGVGWLVRNIYMIAGVMYILWVVVMNPSPCPSRPFINLKISCRVSVTQKFHAEDQVS